MSVGTPFWTHAPEFSTQGSTSSVPPAVWVRQAPSPDLPAQSPPPLHSQGDAPAPMLGAPRAAWWELLQHQQFQDLFLSIHRGVQLLPAKLPQVTQCLPGTRGLLVAELPGALTREFPSMRYIPPQARLLIPNRVFFNLHFENLPWIRRILASQGWGAPEAASIPHLAQGKAFSSRGLG